MIRKIEKAVILDYRRGELGVELTAVIGRSPYQQDDGEGVITRAQVRDFLIDTHALLLAVLAARVVTAV